jgi:hypothetical protein
LPLFAVVSVLSLLGCAPRTEPAAEGDSAGQLRNGRGVGLPTPETTEASKPVPSSSETDADDMPSPASSLGYGLEPDSLRFTFIGPFEDGQKLLKSHAENPWIEVEKIRFVKSDDLLSVRFVFGGPTCPGRRIRVLVTATAVDGKVYTLGDYLHTDHRLREPRWVGSTMMSFGPPCESLFLPVPPSRLKKIQVEFVHLERSAAWADG